MHSCEKIIEGIWDYLDKEMGEGDILEIQKHLDLCRSCYSRVEFEKLLRDHMRKSTNHVCPEELKRRIKSLIERY